MDAALQDVRLAVDRDRVVDAGRRRPAAARSATIASRSGPTSIVYWWKTWVRPTGRDRRPDRQVGEGRVVAGGDRLAAGRVALQLVELAQPDGGGDVGQPEVVAEDLVVVALAHALVAVEPDPVGQAVVVGGDEAALAGRHVLRAVQAERAVPEAARPAGRGTSAPCAWQASSTTARPWRSAMAVIMSMSAGRPNRWTGQIARVRGVMAASIRAASMT